MTLAQHARLNSIPARRWRRVFNNRDDFRLIVRDNTGFSSWFFIQPGVTPRYVYYTNLGWMMNPRGAGDYPLEHFYFLPDETPQSSP